MPAHNTLQKHLSCRAHASFLQEILRQVTASVEGVSLRSTPPSLRDEAMLADFVVCALSNTWSRAARRKKQNDAMGEETTMETEKRVQLVCRIRWKCDTNATDASQSPTTLTIDWVQGNNRGMFESFANHFWRRVETALQSHT